MPSGSQFPLHTYKALLTSAPVLTATAKELKTAEIYELGTPQDTLLRMRQMLKVDINVDRTIKVAATVPGTPQARHPGEILNRAASTQRDERYRLLARDLVKTTIKHCRRVADQMRVDTDKANVESLEQQVSEAEADYARTKKQMIAMQSRTRIIDGRGYGEGVMKALLDQRASLQAADAQLAGLSRELGQRQQALARASRQIENLPEEVPLLQDLRTAYRDAERKLAQANQMYGPENPLVLQARADVDRLRKELREAAGLLRQGYQQDVMELNATLANQRSARAVLARNVAELERAVRQRSPDVVSLIELQDVAAAQVKRVETLKGQLATARNRYETSSQRWRVLNDPEVPLKKARPATIASALIGALVGAALALACSATALYAMLFGAGRAEPDDELD